MGAAPTRGSGTGSIWAGFDLDRPGGRAMIGHDVRPSVTEPVRSARHGVDAVGWTGAALGAALLALALVEGLIFTFAVAVMPNLADADDRVFVATMQRYDQNPIFPVTFTVALVLIALAGVLQRRHGPAIVRWTIAALVLYAVVFSVTIGIHLSLNNEIDQADLDHLSDLVAVRDRTEGSWVAWNIVRAVLVTAALVALARSLLLQGRQANHRHAVPCATGHPYAPPAGDSARCAPDRQVDSHARTATT